MPNVEFKNIVKQFGNVTVLEDLNLTVNDGEFLVLLGPSGCGKTTLLNLLAGLLEVTAGEILIGGKDVTDLDPKDRGLAMVFQSYALYPTKTVLGNLKFGLSAQKLGKEEVNRRVKWASDLLQITNLLDRRPAQLSGGQRQRVAIGRALVKNVDVFLFDEPLSNLDAKLRTEMRLEIKKLHNELKKTIVFVTHDQVEAMTMATRIAIMDGGVVQQIGTPDEVYEAPANLFVARFIGAPPMNILATEIRKSGGRTFAHHSASNTDIDITNYPFTTSPTEGARVFIGMRPEHFLVGDAIINCIAGFDLPVQYSEKTGSDGTAYLATGDEQLAIRVAPELVKTLSQGAMLKVGFPADRLSIFDATTERRI
ncbi:MAG: ABC transporter ATP-binding protein [Paracoccaceae bacterium]